MCFNVFQSNLDLKENATCENPKNLTKMFTKIDSARVGVYTSELQVDQYMKVNERRNHLSGLIGTIIHNTLLNYCRKYGF